MGSLFNYLHDVVTTADRGSYHDSDDRLLQLVPDILGFEAKVAHVRL